MALLEAIGSETLTTTSAVSLFSTQTLLRYYATKIDLTNMISTSIITIRIFDSVNAIEKIYDTQIFTGVQDIPEVFIPFLPSSNYRVSVQSVDADTTNITIPWSRYTT